MRRMPFVAAFGVVLALVASFAVPTPAHAQQWRPTGRAPLQQPFPRNRWDRYRSHLPRRIVRPHLVASMATVMETEPNDTTTTANLVSLGDTVTGVIDPAGDADYFVIDVPGNTLLDFQLLAVGNFPGMLIICCIHSSFFEYVMRPHRASTVNMYVDPPDAASMKPTTAVGWKNRPLFHSCSVNVRVNLAPTLSPRSRT